MHASWWVCKIALSPLSAPEFQQIFAVECTFSAFDVLCYVQRPRNLPICSTYWTLSLNYNRFVIWRARCCTIYIPLMMIVHMMYGATSLFPIFNQNINIILERYKWNRFMCAPGYSICVSVCLRKLLPQSHWSPKQFSCDEHKSVRQSRFVDTQLKITNSNEGGGGAGGYTVRTIFIHSTLSLLFETYVCVFPGVTFG